MINFVCKLYQLFMKAKGSLLIVPLSHYQDDAVPEGSKADEWEERKADLLMKKNLLRRSMRVPV